MIIMISITNMIGNEIAKAVDTVDRSFLSYLASYDKNIFDLGIGEK